MFDALIGVDWEFFLVCIDLHFSYEFDQCFFFPHLDVCFADTEGQVRQMLDAFDVSVRFEVRVDG